ncbi:hypothetical protein MVEN_00895600 [Mycena venus]|uniref:Uncharacterized protein n=1 Tax=Mycena venus TaxID=2733690 RepID=A0A8H7D4A7_9AGAR|nr:hypothetical protein MVEN_00895600 [Mycena venus]
MCIPLGFHRCWQYNPDLDLIFSLWEHPYSLEYYIQSFLDDLRRAPTIAETYVSSVAYCRTRGPTGYPFLIVRLQHRDFWNMPVHLKVCGDDSPNKMPQLTLGGVDQSIRRLVGTWRYDVYYTISSPHSCDAPELVNLLAIAELAMERDCGRARYPAILFFALKALFIWTVPSSSAKKKMDLTTFVVADEAKSAVIDAFPARKQLLIEKMHSSCRQVLAPYFLEHGVRQAPRAESTIDLERALARVAQLQETVTRLNTVLSANNVLTTEVDLRKIV